MDSQERHDLKQNDLASALDGAKDFWNSPWLAKWGNTILLVIILLIAAMAVRMWANNRALVMEDQLWSDLGTASSPDAYTAIASSYSDVKIRALAHLRAGDLLLERATNGPSVLTEAGPATTQPVTITTDPAADARNAALQYEEVIKLTGVNKLVRLNALLGLASAHENLQKWDDAAKVYEQLKQEAGTDYPILATRATNRLAILPRLKEPVRFAPEAPPAGGMAPPANPGEATGPAPLPGLGTILLPAPEEKKPAGEPAAQPQPATGEAAQ